MRVDFRVDASVDIGFGHVMRCLTLADALRARGAQCRFVCREHPGNLIESIDRKGHTVLPLPPPDRAAPSSIHAGCAAEPEAFALSHSDWLGVSQDQDALETVSVLGRDAPDWMVVDHYSLDVHWERKLRPHVRRLLAVDDLADRLHDCDVLLDQTLGRLGEDYASLVPASCTLLCGAGYALLRPEFRALRSSSIARRAVPNMRHILVTMGGIDKDNVTADVLTALAATRLEGCRVTVVMGQGAPWLDRVRALASRMPYSNEVRVGVEDMATLMAGCDLAIGAAGATSWERCCLALPSIVVVLARNQTQVATALQTAGAAVLLEVGQMLEIKLPKVLRELASSPARLRAMAEAAGRVADGLGATRVTERMEHGHADRCN